jgi:hypothetical protein
MYIPHYVGKLWEAQDYNYSQECSLSAKEHCGRAYLLAVLKYIIPNSNISRRHHTI